MRDSLILNREPAFDTQILTRRVKNVPCKLEFAPATKFGVVRCSRFGLENDRGYTKQGCRMPHSLVFIKTRCTRFVTSDYRAITSFLRFLSLLSSLQWSFWQQASF